MSACGVRGILLSPSGMWRPMAAPLTQGDEEIVRLLLARGADVKAQGKGYYGTPLIAAIESKHDGVADLLLGRGAGVSARGGGTVTPPKPPQRKAMRDWPGCHPIGEQMLTLLRGPKASTRE